MDRPKGGDPEEVRRRGERGRALGFGVSAGSAIFSHNRINLNRNVLPPMKSPLHLRPRHLPLTGVSQRGRALGFVVSAVPAIFHAIKSTLP